MKKFLKVILIIIVIGAIAFGIFSFWFTRTYDMDAAREFEINTPEHSPSLLIATQGSEFKDSILTGLIDHFQDREFYIKVTDIENLDRVEAHRWDAICLIHTWENQKPPPAISTFVEKANKKDHMVSLATSTFGMFELEGVDAIAGASVMDEVMEKTRELIEKLEEKVITRKPNWKN